MTGTDIQIIFFPLGSKILCWPGHIDHLSFLEEASNPQFSQLDLLRARIYRGKEMVVVIVLWVRPWIVLALECFSLFFNLVRPWSVKNGIKPDYVDC
jgi:hypothetical protein